MAKDKKQPSPNPVILSSQMTPAELADRTSNVQSASDNDVTHKHSLTEVEADEIKGAQSELEKVLERNFYMSETYLDIVTKELLDWHNKRELEARIDTLEYAKISPKFKIEERIEKLKQELEKL